MRRELAQKLILTVLLFSCFLSISYAEEYNYRLEDVYTPERVSAFKRVIRYYNPSICDADAERISKAIIYYAHHHKIEDDRFVASVITIESMFNPYAVSRSGAQGLGQLMPGTASDMQVRNAFNIEENVNGSCRYLSAQLSRYKHLPRQQRYELTLAAYNAGPGAVSRWGGVPPYTETKNYVFDVINVWRQLCGMKTMTSTELLALKKKAEKYRQQQPARPVQPTKASITSREVEVIFIEH